MNISPIKTEEDYRATLREIESLMSAEPNSIEGDRLDVLVTLVEAYERQHFPLGLPDPVEAAEALKDLRGTVLRYDDPLEPVGLEDWESLLGTDQRRKSTAP